jgi:hypothetical protein
MAQPAFGKTKRGRSSGVAGVQELQESGDGSLLEIIERDFQWWVNTKERLCSRAIWLSHSVTPELLQLLIQYA